MDVSKSEPTAPTRVLLTMALIVGILWFAREVILPMAMAVLLAFLLSPLVAMLERARIKRLVAVIAIVATLFFVFVGVLWMVGSQLTGLGEQLPAYQGNLISRIRSIKGPLGNSGSALADTVGTVMGEIDGQDSSTEPTTDEPAAVDSRRSGEPQSEHFSGNKHDVRSEPDTPAIPVRIVEPQSYSLTYLTQWMGPLLSPLGTAAIVAVYTIFMLLQRDDLRDRMIRLAGTSHLNLTTTALDEAGNLVSRYLLMLLIVNGSYGLMVWLGLWLIGIPAPAMWGLLAGTLRFVPFVGPWIAAVLPIALSLAVDDGWWVPGQTIALFIVLELISNNVIEPLLYGKSTGVSIVGIIAMASFWTWLWGPLGLVLSMPLTVCLVVMGRHVPQFAFLNILLGDAPALEAKHRYYQRLLAMDYHEAGAIAAETLKTGSVAQLYMDVLAPALSLAERDRHSGELAESRRMFIYDTIKELVEELGEAAREPEAVMADAGASSQAAAERRVARDTRLTQPQGAKSGSRLWCVPAEDDADEIAATMLAQILSAHGYDAEALPAKDLSEDILRRVAEDAADAILISAVAPGGVTHARRLCIRIRAKRPGVTIVIGLWNATGVLTQSVKRLEEAGANGVVTTLQDALTLLSSQTEPTRPTDDDKI